MSKLSSIIGIAALAGIGYYVGKKVFEKKKTELYRVLNENLINGQLI